MRGLGRVVVVTIINFIIVFVIVALIMASIFSIFAYRELKAIVQEEYLAQVRQLEQRMAKASPQAVEEAKKKLNETLWRKYGLLQPVHERILIYTYNLITFNLSFSIRSGINYPVQGDTAIEVTINALKQTAILFTTATIINMLISLFLGLQAAKRAGSLFDRALAIIALISYSLPMWWTGLLLIMLFSFQLRLLPPRAIQVYTVIDNLNAQLEAGKISYIEYLGGYIYAWIRHMALPIMTYLLVAFGGASYVTRSMVLGVTREDFVMVARAKGLPERTVLYKHILRAASPPIVTGIIFGLIGSLGGAIISERVFMWPGMGYVYIIAINAGDAAVLLANTWVTTILYISAYFILDFIYMLLDPRVRVGKGVE